MGTPSVRSKLDGISEIREQLLASSSVELPDIRSYSSFIGGLDDKGVAAVALKRNKKRPLIQPRGGLTLAESQRTLVLALSDAGADFLPVTIDSFTRNNDYDTAYKLLETSNRDQSNLLNGYPLVAHGYKVTRQVLKGLEKPVSLRHGTPDARILVETALASGMTEIEGGGLSYSIPYTRTYPVLRSLLHWQYVDRLCAEVSKNGNVIHRESFGVLTATLVPPVMTVVVGLCELLLAAEQGISSFSLSFSETGSLVQDVALATVLRQLSRNYLDRFDFNNVSTYVVYHQWMGPFPENPDKANKLITMSAARSYVIGADKIVTKTKDEALGIPTINSNVEAVRLTKSIIERGSEYTDISKIEENILAEINRIESETESVMDAIFNLSTESFWTSVNQAFEKGYIDIPFAPHERNNNKLLTRRGIDKGVYIVESGNVPLPKPALLAESSAVASENKNNWGFNDIVDDIYLF